jgi:DNA-binding IclR family transcriptional regulator
MRKIRQVLRLKAAGLKIREIAASTGAARTTVYEYLVRAEGAGMTWPLREDLDDESHVSAVARWSSLESRQHSGPLCGAVAERRLRSARRLTRPPGPNGR